MAGQRPSDRDLRVNAACERFEDAWRRGRSARIEDYLVEAVGADRTALLSELLGLEVELRRVRGDHPQPREYLARFPGYWVVVRAAFGAEVIAVEATPRAGAARELLFGILAIQNNFISRDDLLVAFNAWVSDKSRSLGRDLLERGALDPGRHAVLEALVAEHLKLLGGDPETSLSALPPLGSAVHDLERITDPDIQASLALLTVDRAATVTCDWQVAMPTESLSTSPRFTILRPHARGGLGEVFVARDQELNREVALKQIRPVFAHDPGCRARFVLEAEVTGGLEHPAIVPVYGLGTYADGRPYYAMRFIKGDSLKDAALAFHAAGRAAGHDPGERALEFRRLLQRFIDVCEAVAYAHSRGVLHRDLKPGNVMLGRYGETLLVDWGLAKPLGRREAPASAAEVTLTPACGAGTTPTQQGSALGTPAYMSPEQAAGRLDDLGPASDIYGLGATLYYLLTGRAPIEGANLDDILARARRGDFPPPRRIERSIPPALEAVCMKAMALRPADRYRSPLALREDLEHWLADEPVAVWREPVAVRARRWARRHRSVVTGAAAAALAGLVGLVAVAAVQARANGRLTTANETTRNALARSQESHRRAEAVLSFLKDNVLAAARPEGQQQGLGWDVTLRQAVDAAEPKIAEAFRDQPAVEAELRFTLGETYRYTGAPLLAVRQHALALKRRQAALGPDDDATLTSRISLAGAYQDAGRTKEAVELHEATRKLLEAKLGPDHPRTLECRNDLAEAYRADRRVADALRLHEATLKLMESKYGPDHLNTLTSRNNLASAYDDAGRFAEAIRLHEATIARFEARFGPDHPDTLVARSNLAVTYQNAGRFAEAIALQEQILKARASKLGPDHPSTLISRTSLGAAYRGTGLYAQAVEFLRPTLVALEAKVGANHVFTASCRKHLVGAYESLERWADAEPLRRFSLDHHRATEKPGSPILADDLAALGLDVLKQSKWREAEALLRECLAIREMTMANDWRRFNTTSQLGAALLGQMRFAEAEPLVGSGWDGMNARAASIPTAAQKGLFEAGLRAVELYESWGKPKQAASWRAKLGLAALPADVFAPPQARARLTPATCRSDNPRAASGS